jgi:anti-anti-sigma regulatory factor
MVPAPVGLCCLTWDSIALKPSRRGVASALRHIRDGSGPTVVFSFFKKDPKDARKGAGGRSKPTATGPRTGGATDVATRPLAKPIGRPLTGPTGRPLDRTGASSAGLPPTEAALPDRERARNHARQTAAKIDQIEAEMARDLMGHPSRGRATLSPRSTLPPVLAAEPTTTSTPTTVKTTAAVDPLEQNSELLGGNIDAIEINTSLGCSVIDEAAILFANDEVDSAENLLRTGLRRDDLGPSTRMAWHMLFELLNQRGDRTAFEQLSMDYALRFEHSPPGWMENVDAPADSGAVGSAQSAPVDVSSTVRLPESVDAGVVGHLEQLRSLTATQPSVQLDVTDVRRVDIDGASLLLRVIGAFKRSHRELILVGAADFAGVLARMVESGRRDSSDALWMLLLEVLRLLARHDEFEEAAIQYCITFEVSPPSWEPPPPNLKVAPASAAPGAGRDGPAAGSMFALRGTIDGKGEPYFGRMIAAARNQPQVVIDCGQLRRLTYSAGSALLGTLGRIRQGGSKVELRNVSALVAALLHLLGINSIASVQSRYV